MQKTARKSTKYSGNETVLKSGHLAKALAHAKATAFGKFSIWVENLGYYFDAIICMLAGRQNAMFDYS